MRLYVGSRDYKPDGYMTLDISPAEHPDIVADITNMPEIESEHCDEIYASHVLEHISWPKSLLAFSEFARILKVGGILKIAVPDVVSLLQQISSQSNEYWAMGLIYGVGGINNEHEIHRYGFTQNMIMDILYILGFSDFDWWNSDICDASSGWMFVEDGRKSAVSLNIKATKVTPPLLSPSSIYDELIKNPLCDFREVVLNMAGTHGANMKEFPLVESVYQRIHFNLIEATLRIKHLEEEIGRLRNEK